MKVVYNGEMDTRAAKEILGRVIPDMCEKDSDVIYLDADLMNCIGTLKWGMQHPERAIDCGIAEANMIGVAAGLAAEGFKPICHTFGPFASRRCFDQLFISAGYAKNDITVIGTDPGVTAALNGGTHMPFEDVALYRTIPTATIFEPSDLNCLESILRQCPDIPGVKYIRVGRKNLAKVYEDGVKAEVGKAQVLRDGKDVTIVAAGIMIHEAMQAAKELAEEGIDAAVIDMFTIKPIDAKTIEEYAKKTGRVVVCENHSKHGGLYSAVLEVLSEHCPVPAECVAVEDEFGEVGPQNYLQERFGLTKEHVKEQVKKVLSR